MDMLNGSIGDKILKFALPLALTGILQQLFNAADVIVMGRFVSKNAMAAVGSNAPLINLIIGLFVGISLGANVVIAKLTGEGNTKSVGRAVHTAVSVAVISGVIMTVIGEIFARPVLHLMSVPSEVFDMSLIYLRVYLAGMPVILLYNFTSAIFRSQGNTRTPLICLFTSGVINVLLNLFFVLVFGMKTDGVALATVIANLISSSLLIFFLHRENSAIKFRFRSLCIDKRILKEMIRIGVPAGIQGMLFSFSNIIIQSSINKLGADIMAASSAAFNIEIFVYYVVNAFGQACTTFTGQNYGANKPARCKKVLRLSLAQNIIFTAVISAVVILFGKPLLSCFNEDPVVIKYGIIRLRYIVGTEVVNCVIETLSGCMRGYGYSFVPALICIFGICGVRVGMVFTVFKAHPVYDVLMSTYPISWAVTAVALIISYIILKNTRLKKFFE